jgi:hypothetical protein
MLTASLLAAWSSSPLAQGLDPRCGGKLDNAVGPFDYRKHVMFRSDPNDILRNVESNHFSDKVENLQGGITGSLGEDLNYVLRAFPNHHRALAAVHRLSTKRQSEQIPGLQFTVSCYFERAIALAPDDARVREIYGVHLSKLGKNQAALAQYQAALELGANDANTYYNLGLLYFDAKDYDKSLEYAKKAYAGGFPLRGLREKLQRAGKWRD